MRMAQEKLQNITADINYYKVNYKKHILVNVARFCLPCQEQYTAFSNMGNLKKGHPYQQNLPTELTLPP